MKIKRTPKLFKKFPTYDDLIDKGYDVDFSGGECEDDEGNPARWYCSLYYGDSNAPWKLGTVTGVGFGMDQHEAYVNAIENAEEVCS